MSGPISLRGRTMPRAPLAQPGAGTTAEGASSGGQAMLHLLQRKQQGLVWARRWLSSPAWVHFEGGKRIEPGQVRPVWQWCHSNTLLLPGKNQRTPLPWCQHNCQRDRTFNQTRNSSSSNQTKSEQNRADQESTVENSYIFLLSFPFPVLSCHLPWASSGTASLHGQLNQFSKTQGEIKRISFFSEPSWIGWYFNQTRNISGTRQGGRSRETEEEELRRAMRQDNT